jgi:hypothetical protein
VFSLELLIADRAENRTGKLKSILAKLDYTHQVLQYDKNGIPFCTYLYVPEIHPITGCEYHEREDDAHVLKVHYNISPW